MKAYVYDRFGPPEVLHINEIDKPAPRDDEVLIKVKATTVNAADCNLRGMTFIPPGLGFLAKIMLGFNKTKVSVLGSVVAGVIEEAGKNVPGFKKGDEVFGTGPELGAYAEYTCRSAKGAIARKPAHLSYEEAAAVPYGALTAYYFLKNKAKLKPGQTVLVHGASGGVGSFAVQLAKAMGAHVTGVCGPDNMEWVKSLGADEVIDYSREDFSKRNQTWDVIFDVVVGKTSFARVKKSLNPKGSYLAVAGGVKDMFSMLGTSLSGGKKVVFGGGTACEIKENLEDVASMLKEGKIQSTLTKTFSWDEMIEAHRYAESGGKRGNIAVTIEK